MKLPLNPTCAALIRFLSVGLLLILAAFASPANAQPLPKPGTLFENGAAQLPVATGSVEGPAKELHETLNRMTGVRFQLQPAAPGKAGIHVGLITDFPWLKVDRAKELGAEGFVIRTDSDSVYLVAAEPLGVQHAVTTFLHHLGCRWFFPGETWESIPQHKTIAGNWNERQVPSFPTQRRIWYGFGAYPSGKRDMDAWERHNRMGGPVNVSIGHTWHGLNPEKEFAAHPEWFALVAGKRQTTKPCYSHPQVIERAIESALKQASDGRQMISMTPPDGLGYCECERCLATLKGGEPIREHSSIFAKRPDGTLVNITSETMFNLVNQVAAAVAKKYPRTLVGCYAYSAYSHPPSFDLHPNVYLQTTTAYRRTSITLAEQLDAFGKKTKQVGIREYYSVYQWDWDFPSPGKMTPAALADDLKMFHQHHITAVNAEASNNWGPRGLGYYVASQLMWNVNADVKEIVRDFYETAFGPAAKAMQRYYVRWYGPSVAVLPDDRPLPAQADLVEKGKFDVEALKAAYLDLDDAARAVPADSDYRKRIDLLRMYAHYLVLRYHLNQAEAKGEKAAILDAIKAETMFGARLTDTHMIHTRPLLGKAFLRRFKKHEALLADVEDAKLSNKGWRQVAAPPDAREFETLWAADKAALGIR
ncbi:MAG: DUF4838 domain-containing protein [Phycisphaeraceae bacterium]